MNYEILVISNNLNEVKEIYQHLKNQYEIKILLNTNKDLISILSNSKIKVLLIDESTIEILQKQNLESILKNIKIILILNNSNIINYLNVDFYNCINKILIKPFKWKQLQNDLKKIFKLLENDILKIKATKVLDIFTLNKKRIGYECIKVALIESYKDISLIQNLEKFLYSKVSCTLKISNVRRFSFY